MLNHFGFESEMQVLQKLAELKWAIGLNKSLPKDKGFYGILSVATILGLVLNLTSIDPMKALFWSSVINGVVAVPIMVTMMLLTANPKVTESLKLPQTQKIIGWLSTAVMFAVAAGMVATWKS